MTAMALVGMEDGVADDEAGARRLWAKLAGH
jgi:hypothetical protein